MATQVIRGNGSPEGFIEAGRGTFYINTQSSSIFVKIKGDETTNKGWRAVSVKGYYEGSEDPNNKVHAPKYAVYYIEDNDTLYIQMNTGDNILDYGWVPVNKGIINVSRGNPNDNKVIGTDGDIYIDNEIESIYVYANQMWDALSLIIVDSTDIMIKLSELLTNTTGIIHQYFNMFLNPTPMDIELAQYDSDGILRTYTIPNRAKDTICLVGAGNPEDKIFAVMGQLYLDVDDGTPYIKKTEFDQNRGWVSLKLPNFSEPLSYDNYNNTLSIITDPYPMNGSHNLLDSHVILQELDKIRNGNSQELFSVAEPILEEHDTTKNYVDNYVQNMHSNIFGYNKSNKTLYINAPLSQDTTSKGTVIGKSGSFFTPMFGNAYSTVFTLDSILKEEENTEVSIFSDIPCTVVLSTENGNTNTLEFTYMNQNLKCFNEDMIEGIKKIQIISTVHYDWPRLEDIKSIYANLKLNVRNLIDNEA